MITAQHFVEGAPGTAAEFDIMWEALAQYVENGRDAVEGECAPRGFEAKLATAEKVLARYDAAVAKIADIEGAA